MKLNHLDAISAQVQGNITHSYQMSQKGVLAKTRAVVSLALTEVVRTTARSVSNAALTLLNLLGSCFSSECRRDFFVTRARAFDFVALPWKLSEYIFSLEAVCSDHQEIDSLHYNPSIVYDSLTIKRGCDMAAEARDGWDL